MNILQILDNHIAEGRDPLWYFPEEKLEIPLSQLQKQSFSIASFLQSKNISKNDTIGIILENSSTYISLLLAIWRIGGIAVPIRNKAAHTFNFLSHIQKMDAVCNFKIIIFSFAATPDYLKEWEKNSLKKAIPIGEIIQFQNNSPLQHDTPLSNSDIALIQFSSGSTAEPKGVMVTHGMIINQVELLWCAQKVRLKGVPFYSLASWLPFYHDMGFFIGILQPIYHAANNAIASPRYFILRTIRWFEILSERKAQFSCITNSSLDYALEAFKRKELTLDLSNLHIYISAEKAFPVTIRKAIKELNRFQMTSENIHVAYGMAENALGATATFEKINIVKGSINSNNVVSLNSQNSENPCYEYASVGTPFENTIISIWDDQGRSQPELTLGEILIEGPCVTPGYYNNGALSSQKIVDKKLKTGDLGFMYNGELYFHSRKDDLIILNGQNIIPDDIEQCVEAHSFVRPGGSVLFEVDTDKGTRLLYLLIEAKENENSKFQEYKKQIQSKIFSEFGILINSILFCQHDDLEKTSSGKKRRKVIQKRFIEGKIITIKD